MSGETRKLPGDIWSHVPLPYEVRLRLMLDDDHPGETQVWRGTAYSAMEAILQATYAIGGRVGAELNCRVESVQPDLEAYFGEGMTAIRGLRGHASR